MTIMTGDGFLPIPDVKEMLGRAADGLYVALAEVPVDALEPTAAGQRVVRALGATARVGYAMHAAAATEVVLEAIERSDGTRASVLEQLRTIELKDGIIGDVRFDPHGDMTPAKITIFRVRPGDAAGEGYDGAVLDRVVTVPTD